MMNTNEYRTKTIFKNCDYPSFNENFWPVAIDFGYSAVKGVNPNLLYCFPNYAMRLSQGLTLLGDPDDAEIYYRDCETNEIWIVGENAQALVSASSSDDSLTALYGRNRFFSEMFKVISRVGMGIGIGEALMEGKHPVIQTGLPPAYLKSDASMLKEALSGYHSFDIRVGKNGWKHYEFTLGMNDIKVMPQPMGTLISIATKNDGTPANQAQDFFKSRVLIFDAGFGTLDTYYMEKRTISNSETFDNLGMKQVLINTTNSIFKNLGVEINVSAMQKYLETGQVTKLDRRTMKSGAYAFGDILETESKKVCMQALEKVKEVYNYLQETDYLVITGGTGAAWENFIREHLSAMETLKIVSGNINDDLPYVFANVRGYYMFLVNSLRAA